MEDLIRYALRFLPLELQYLYTNPPNLNNPSSFLPLFRLLWPLTRYIVVLLAFYIVWTTISGVFGYFTRFTRFAIRMGPIIGLIGWIMAASGQGSMPELFEMVKQWTGLSSGGTGAKISPGIASLAGLFDGGKKSTSKTRRTKSKDKDSFSSMLNSAAEYINGNADADWVQGYVKQAIAKASGLDWLFNQQQEGGTKSKSRKK